MAPENEHAKGVEYYRTILDAIPSPVLVVEDDARVVDLNAAASGLSGKRLEMAFGKRTGEVLDCENSIALGCGKSPPCIECVVRNSTMKSLSGEKVVRERWRMQLVSENGTTPIHLLVTTSPFQYGDNVLVLVILEDISELMEIRDLVPVCSWCKKVRDDENYWKTLESYIEKQLDVRTTHGICPECAQVLRSEIPKQ